MPANRYPAEDGRRLARMRWLSVALLATIGLPTLAAVLRALAG